MDAQGGPLAFNLMLNKEAACRLTRLDQSQEAAMSHLDEAYLLARAEEERELACRTTDEIARANHLKAAFDYSVRARSRQDPGMGEGQEDARHDIAPVHWPRGH